RSWLSSNSYRARNPADNSTRNHRARPPVRRFAPIECRKATRSGAPAPVRQSSLQACCLDWPRPGSLAASIPRDRRPSPRHPRGTPEQKPPAGSPLSAPWVFAESPCPHSFVAALDCRHFGNYSLAAELRDNSFLLGVADHGLEFHDRISTRHGHQKMLHRNFHLRHQLLHFRRHRSEERRVGKECRSTWWRRSSNKIIK